MAKLILGVTGSVAAVKTPALLAALRQARHDVRVVVTRPALYFFDPAELDPTGGAGVAPAPIERAGETPAPQSNAGSRETLPDRTLFGDEDEWPGTRYQRGDEVLHIAFRNWADLLIVAPLDANTLAKFALGLSDNFLTCVFRAWDFAKPVILAPAMNTLMWQSPVTLRHLRQILEDRSTATGPVPSDWTLDEAPLVFARHAPRIVLIPPQAKRLACGDIGLGAMAEVVEIAEVVRQWSA